MKKILGISLVAVLAVSPLMASAADTAPVAIPEAKSGIETKTSQTPVATQGKYYAGETITDADKAAAASAAYVKGAYNAGISAVNKVAEDLDNHKADTTVHITAAERTTWNGKQDAITEQNKLSAGLVSGLATVATSGQASDLTTDATHRFVTETEKTTWSGKQNALDTTQMAAVNSGINSTKVGQYDTLVTNSANFATKEGVSASIDKATAKGNISATVSGNISGSVTSNVSALKIGGGTITNTVTPTTVNVPTSWAGSSNMMVNWGDQTPGTLNAAVTGSGSQAVMTGATVASSLANATVTSGSISNTLTGTVSGTATQNNVEFDVKSAGYFDNASDTAPDYGPANS